MTLSRRGGLSGWGWGGSNGLGLENLLPPPLSPSVSGCPRLPSRSRVVVGNVLQDGLPPRLKLTRHRLLPLACQSGRRGGGCVWVIQWSLSRRLWKLGRSGAVFCRGVICGEGEICCKICRQKCAARIRGGYKDLPSNVWLVRVPLWFHGQRLGIHRPFMGAPLREEENGRDPGIPNPEGCNVT